MVYRLPDRKPSFRQMEGRSAHHLPGWCFPVVSRASILKTQSEGSPDRQDQESHHRFHRVLRLEFRLATLAFPETEHAHLECSSRDWKRTGTVRDEYHHRGVGAVHGLGSELLGAFQRQPLFWRGYHRRESVEHQLG